MINGSLLPIFFQEGEVKAGGTHFANRYFAVSYFSNYMPPLDGFLTSDPFADKVEFELTLNKNNELLLSMNQDANLQLLLDTEKDLELTMNTDVIFEVER